MQKCGFCSMLSGLLRRAMCVSSSPSSSGESYYRELGDQETLRIGDRFSMVSDDSGDIICFPPEMITQVEMNHIMITHRRLCTGRFLTMHKRRKKRLLTRNLKKDRALLDDLQLGQVQCILYQSNAWKFNAFTLDNVSAGRCLPVLCLHLFHVYGLISHFQLDVTRVWKLFSLIEDGYHSTNPYHNSVHATDVTQAMHCFLQQNKILDYLEPIEIMASLLAAIAHDMDHPGVNQAFLIATSNHLAALYKNKSVLENHHWRSAMSCIIESRIIEGLGIKDELEQQIRSLILATDITRQHEFLNQFKSYMDTNTLDLTKKEHRHLVLQISLKCADISNPCRPWDISRKWSFKVCEEFFRQGDYERKLKLPVTALCDRHTTSIPKIQSGFFKFVVTPLITEWHRFLQNDLSAQMLKNLLYNQEKWKTLLEQEAADETKTEISDSDLIDDDLETYSETNISDSSELLLPIRRSSLNPTKPTGLKAQLRRFSVPLNIFQDSRFKTKEKKREASEAEIRKDIASLMGSDQSILAQLSLGHCDHSGKVEKVLSTEKLLPDSSIASITTPVQATRLNTVIKGSGTFKLVRQQTFPPVYSNAKRQALLCRPLYTSNEDTIYPTRKRAELDVPEKKISAKKDDTKKTDKDDAFGTANADDETAMKGKDVLELKPPKPFEGRRDSGTQLLENLTSVKLGPSDQLLCRHKSMSTETVEYTPKEKKVCEVTPAIPHLLKRTLSGIEGSSRRRGSAPSPIAATESRVASLGALRNSLNGGRRKQSPIVTCQKWFAKATYNVQDRSQLPRRSSLPVEVITGI